MAGVVFSVSPSRGALCGVCRLVIQSGLLKVTATGYKTSASAHIECLLKLRDGATAEQIQEDAERSVEEDI